jgi:hypothetical protein
MEQKHGYRARQILIYYSSIYKIFKKCWSKNYHVFLRLSCFLKEGSKCTTSGYEICYKEVRKRRRISEKTRIDRNTLLLDDSSKR